MSGKRDVMRPGSQGAEGGMMMMNREEAIAALEAERDELTRQLAAAREGEAASDLAGVAQAQMLAVARQDLANKESDRLWWAKLAIGIGDALETPCGMDRAEWARQVVADLKAARAEIERLRAELAPYQLPADGEPLTLVQRAVALEAGRECRMGEWVFWISGRDIVVKDERGRFFEDTAAMAFFDSRETVTLLPLPTPRQLTFAEAVALAVALIDKHEAP